ncbi:MAG: T9SS type A sorting domain-containing protein, partial [Saprospiraceae bacterium]|nr:T9SS type A sorting domain-containing protein [Saprospiraceae bacterium]
GTDWSFNHKMVPSDRLDLEASNQQFGFSLAADGGRLIVGAYQRFDGTMSNVGAVYFFEEDNGAWEEKIMLRPGDGVTGDFFGWDVDLKGSTAVVGALNHDFDLNGGEFRGESGAAYFLNWDGGTWVSGGKLIWSDRDNGDFFGSSVAITPDEERIIVGMYEDNTQFEFDDEVYNKSECGAAVVFSKNSSGLYEEVQRITPSIKATGDHFGNSMAATNNSLVIGSYQDDIESFPNQGLCNLDVMADNGAVDLFSLDPMTGLANLESDLEISIYPNPTLQYLNISSSRNLESAEILNLEGRILMQISLKGNQRINTASLQAGLYFLKVSDQKSIPFLKY